MKQTRLVFCLVLSTLILGIIVFLLTAINGGAPSEQEIFPIVQRYSAERECESATGEGCMLSTCYFNAEETTQQQACGEGFTEGWIPASSDMAKRNPRVGIEPGDVFGTMEVVSVEPRVDSGLPSPVTPSNLRIKFKGATTVTGVYEYVVSGIGFAGACMRDLDKSPIPLLPIPQRGGGQHGEPMGFCFNNEDEAKVKQELAPYDGEKITVEIDEYTYSSCECETVDRGRFVRIVK